ncbi:MAG: hypothetical protein H0T79_03295 [Deltaproteobacteria bacterium]|nr:hypothetical protein [Deltaproteobacteria bacterium]
MIDVPIPSEPDHVRRRPLVQAAIVIVVSIIASILAVVLLAGRQLGLAEGRLDPPERIDTRVFQLETDAEAAVRASAKHLQSYGWVDKQRQRVHVPIEVALELYLKQEQSP